MPIRNISRITGRPLRLGGQSGGVLLLMRRALMRHIGAGIGEVVGVVRLQEQPVPVGAHLDPLGHAGSDITDRLLNLDRVQHVAHAATSPRSTSRKDSEFNTTHRGMSSTHRRATSIRSARVIDGLAARHTRYRAVALGTY